MRTLVIGDIHGAAKALEQVLERSNFDFENDTLITLGDICDGWSEVKQCVDLLLKIRKRFDITGNHDEWFKEFIEFGWHPQGWEYGGMGTFKSYENHDRIFGDKSTYLTVPVTHQKFFKEQHLYYIDDKNRMFVHAGWSKQSSISNIKAHQPYDFYYNRDLWQKALTCAPNTKLKTIDNFEEIFIGHTATVNWKPSGRFSHLKDEDSPNMIVRPMNSGGVWNLDTGSGWCGKLTIMDVDSKEYWQSDLVQTLYPNEKGRN